jgi:hypothetical protein
VTDSWTTKLQMPTPRKFAAGRVVGGKFYVVGGLTVDSLTARTEVYDPAANSWAVRANVPTARAYAAAGSSNGVLFVFGGSSATRSRHRNQPGIHPLM